MGKIFATQFHKGSLVEQISGTTLTLTGTPIFRDTDKGMACCADSNVKLSLPSSSLFSNQSKLTFSFSIKWNEGSFGLPIEGVAYAIESNSTNYLYFAQYRSNGIYIAVSNGGNAYVTVPQSNIVTSQWYHFVVVYDGTQTGNANRLKVYLNSNQLSLTSNFTGTIPSSTTSNPMTFNMFYTITDGAYSRQKMTYLSIYNTAFTQSDINKDYSAFLKSTNIKKPKSILKMKPNDLKESGLVGAYNCTIQQGKVNDISGNNNHALITTPVTSTLNGIRIGSTGSGKLTISTSSTTDNIFQTGGSILMTMNVNSAGNGSTAGTPISKYGAGGKGWTIQQSNQQLRFLIYFTGGYKQWITTTNPIIYGTKTIVSLTYDGSASGNTPIMKVNGVSQTLTLTTSGSWSYVSDAATQIDMGTEGGSSKFDGELNEVKIYKRILSDLETTKYYTKKVEITLYEDFSNNGADNVSKLPDGWQIRSGTYGIFEKGGLTGLSKYLQDITVGEARTISNTAYGTWEFDMYRNSTSVFVFNFILRLTNNGYGLYCDSSGRFIMVSLINLSNNVTMMQSATSYIAGNTWYRIKITRSVIGVFTAYIKGGSYGSTYILINSSEAGSNPYTETTYTTSNSIYLKHITAAGSKIANIKISDRIIL